MYKKQNLPTPDFRFKHFNNKSYALFNSLHKQVRIGVLAVTTLTFANPETLSAQTEKTTDEGEMQMDGIEVIGSRVPLTQSEAARIVTVLDRKTIEHAPVHSVNDLLKYAAGIDVRQRGDMGIQTDISIRGGTFDQITILLNGVNISNPHTGHLAADFPVAIEDIERIEILEGPAARLFGTSAFNGAINIVTSAENQKHVQIHVTGGSYGLGGGGLRLNLTEGPGKTRFQEATCARTAPRQTATSTYGAPTTREDTPHRPPTFAGKPGSASRSSAPTHSTPDFTPTSMKRQTATSCPCRPTAN